MPVFTTDNPKHAKHHRRDPHYETRRVVNEVILWLGFIASLATLVAFIVLINDIANREGVTFKDIDTRLRKIEMFLLPQQQNDEEMVSQTEATS